MYQKKQDEKAKLKESNDKAVAKRVGVCLAVLLLWCCWTGQACTAPPNAVSCSYFFVSYQIHVCLCLCVLVDVSKRPGSQYKYRSTIPSR